MNLEELQSACREVGTFFSLLVEQIRPSFPHYAYAIKDELSAKTLTNDRWNRIVNILSSLSALPGTCFNRTEHDRRGWALSSVVIAKEMARATFYSPDRADDPVWFARKWAEEIKRDMEVTTTERPEAVSER